MMSKSILDVPPSGLLRAALRLPIWLYRAGLGWLLGDRFLMLTHTGRKSGRKHETVIEVVKHEPGTGTYYVVSGWGSRSDWYLNVRKNPLVSLQIGTKHVRARGRGRTGNGSSATSWRSTRGGIRALLPSLRGSFSVSVFSRDRKRVTSWQTACRWSHSGLCKPGKPIASPNPRAVALSRLGPVKHCLAEQEQEVK